MLNNETGLIILNLGSPESFEAKDVKEYLDQFLMDERVIDIPYFFRLLLVKGLITPSRSKKSAAAYKTIWTEKGSPLVVTTKEFCKLLKEKLDMPAVVAMRYGNPTPLSAINQLKETLPSLKKLLILPMYPHYAMSSYETAVECLKQSIKTSGLELQTEVLKPFYDQPDYIKILSGSISVFLEQGVEYDAILFSYHGLPVRHLRKSDPTKKHCYSSADCCEINSEAWKYCYKHQVKTTTKLVAEELNLSTDKILITFQSRLGSGWIEPFTDVTLAELPAQGIKKLLVVCPAFVADCLETLEEINDKGRHCFMDNGGELFNYVPCLNTAPEWVNIVADWCNNKEGESNQLWE